MSLELNLFFGSLAGVCFLYVITFTLLASTAIGHPEFYLDCFFLGFSMLWTCAFSLIYFLPRHQGKIN
jgi:hypothetical protein